MNNSINKTELDKRYMKTSLFSVNTETKIFCLRDLYYNYKLNVT